MITMHEDFIPWVRIEPYKFRWPMSAYRIEPYRDFRDWSSYAHVKNGQEGIMARTAGLKIL